jgi:hypothetical protein
MVKASQTLPQGYGEQGRISLKQNKRLFLWLNVLAVPWALLCALVWAGLTLLLRPGDVALRRLPLPLENPWLAAGAGVAGVVLTLLVVLVLHELVHGLWFWLFTRARPTFGVKSWYAYAAAPGWYLPRGQFLVVGGAPLLFLSVLGGILVLLVPGAWVLWVLVGLIGNAVGAIGDLYLIARLALAPSAVVIEDQGEEIRWYGPS